MDSSSSAINTRGIADHILARSTQPGSRLTADEITLAEEAYVDIAPFRGRRSEAGLEPRAFARLQCGLLQHRVPGADLGALRVADAKAQPRQFDYLAGLAHDHALHHRHRPATRHRPVGFS